jgi:hypothetical protein
MVQCRRSGARGEGEAGGASEGGRPGAWQSRAEQAARAASPSPSLCSGVRSPPMASLCRTVLHWRRRTVPARMRRVGVARSEDLLALFNGIQPLFMVITVCSCSRVRAHSIVPIHVSSSQLRFRSQLLGALCSRGAM